MSWIEVEQSVSNQGYIYTRCLERHLRMPRIPDWMLSCAAYLYGDVEAARAKQRMGGSGFIVGFPDGLPEPVRPPRLSVEDVSLAAGNWFYYAVTSRHVIANKEAPVVRINTIDGNADIIVPDLWFSHTVSDIAIAPIEVLPLHHALVVGLHVIMTEDQVKELDVGVGDDVYMVGRFINHEGEETNSPTLRCGNISMMPGLPFKVENDPRAQVGYLVETRTIPGYSGSPVFLNVPSWELLSNAPGSPRRRTGEDNRVLQRLLGLAGGWMKGRNKPLTVGGGKKVESWRNETNTGMMWCVPSYRLLELLNQPEVLEQREALRQHWQDFPPAGAPA